MQDVVAQPPLWTRYHILLLTLEECVCIETLYVGDKGGKRKDALEP